MVYAHGQRMLVICGVVTALLAGIAERPALGAPPADRGQSNRAVVPGKPQPPSPVDTSTCTSPSLSQPFLWTGDPNWYTLVAGQSPGSFDGSGWTLSRGARVVTAQVKGGQGGSVLDLPSGAMAVSPPICVTSQDPAARAMVRNVTGGQGIAFYIAYAGKRTWAKPQKTGQFHGRHGTWTPSTRINLLPSHRTSGWQIARFVFVGGGKQSDFQVYDFYVDPRMKA
ncbi:MAG: hypothetical protein ACXVUL_18820 [Solirubrobacteraceae bacterium]